MFQYSVFTEIGGDPLIYSRCGNRNKT